MTDDDDVSWCLIVMRRLEVKDMVFPDPMTAIGPFTKAVAKAKVEEFNATTKKHCAVLRPMMSLVEVFDLSKEAGR